MVLLSVSPDEEPQTGPRRDAWADFARLRSLPDVSLREPRRWMEWTPPATESASMCQSRGVNRKEESAMKSTIIAVDLAKSVFQIAVSHHHGKVAESHRLARSKFLRFFAERQPAVVLLEACGTAHYWARQLGGLGHQVRLLPPHAVRPYVSRNKTDR